MIQLAIARGRRDCNLGGTRALPMILVSPSQDAPCCQPLGGSLSQAPRALVRYEYRVPLSPESPKVEGLCCPEGFILGKVAIGAKMPCGLEMSQRFLG